MSTSTQTTGGPSMANGAGLIDLRELIGEEPIRMPEGSDDRLAEIAAENIDWDELRRVAQTEEGVRIRMDQSLNGSQKLAAFMKLAQSMRSEGA